MQQIFANIAYVSSIFVKFPRSKNYNKRIILRLNFSILKICYHNLGFVFHNSQMNNKFDSLLMTCRGYLKNVSLQNDKQLNYHLFYYVK